MNKKDEMKRKRYFAAMYDEYADDIFKYLYVHVRDRELAEDLTADTFMRAWEHIDSFDLSQPRPWLYKIARNLMTDYWRKKKPVLMEEEADPVSDVNVEEAVDRQLSKEQVQTAIDKLPPVMKSVVTMRFILGYSARKTAESLQTSENNVRIIQYRALRKMKDHLA